MPSTGTVLVVRLPRSLKMKYVAEALVDETKEEMIYFWQPKPEDYEYKRPVAERGTASLGSTLIMAGRNSSQDASPSSNRNQASSSLKPAESG